MNFGAFVEILPGKEGLVRIGELADYHVPSVEDVVSVGRRGHGGGHRDRPPGPRQPVPQGGDAAAPRQVAPLLTQTPPASHGSRGVRVAGAALPCPCSAWECDSARVRSRLVAPRSAEATVGSWRRPDGADSYAEGDERGSGLCAVGTHWEVEPSVGNAEHAGRAAPGCASPSSRGATSTDTANAPGPSRGHPGCGHSEAALLGWLGLPGRAGRTACRRRESRTRCLGQDADEGHEQDGDEEFHAGILRRGLDNSNPMCCP